MHNMQKLKKEIEQTGLAISIDEIKPNEADNTGNIEIAIDANLKLQFAAIGASCCVAIYCADMPDSREAALQSLRLDLAEGFEPMSVETASACGIEL